MDDLKAVPVHGGESQPHTAATASLSDHPPETHRLTYQVITRHLAKFRDGARSLLDLLEGSAHRHLEASHQPLAESQVSEPNHPLELRIERHMATLNRAIDQIRDHNPEHARKADLPTAVREQIAVKERTIRDIVAAEVHFWAAAIENSPRDTFDETEQAWVRGMIRLADTLGVDDDHREYLDFLKEWASQAHA